MSPRNAINSTTITIVLPCSAYTSNINNIVTEPCSSYYGGFVNGLGV